MDKTAIVILNWDGKKMLEKYLPSVVENSDEATIYVVDNASSDDSLDFVHLNFPSVKTIKHDENYGFANGYNFALAKIEAEYFILLNNDVYTPENWLQPLIDFMDSNQDVAACAPKLLSDSDRQLFEYAGAAGGYIDKYGYPFCRGRIFTTIEIDKHQYDEPKDVLWASGACLCARAHIYNNVGGLDGSFFAHCEEIDFCWRLNNAGYRVCIVPKSIVYHLGGGTLPKSNPMKTFLNFRNNLTMLYKNLPDDELNKVLRTRRWLDYLAAAQMLLLKHNMKEARAVIKARKAFKKWCKEFEHDRTIIQKSKVEKPTVTTTPFSILWHYYVLNHKRFSDLPIIISNKAN